MDKRAKERVEIAKDALEWIEAGALHPITGIFVSPTHTPSIFNYNKQLRDVVLGECAVCAKGALLLAKAVRFDNVLVEQYNHYFGCSAEGGALRQHFDQDQLQLIEGAFEGFFGEPGCRDFYKKHADDKQRLIVILKNIIKNKGTFVLHQE